MVVTVEYYRTWHKTLERAVRIMRARLYARAKGLKTLNSVDPEAYELQEIRSGESWGTVEVDGQTYQITEPSLRKLTSE